MDSYLNLLVKYVRQEDVALFIGSGFSFKAGAPHVGDLIKMILKEGGEDFSNALNENEKNNLRILSQKFIDYRGRHDLMEVLREAFRFSPSDTSDQDLLTKIPHIKLIFTTNYDTLIEDAYEVKNRLLIYNNKACAYVNDNLVSIYKLHGDITTLNDPDSIVITDDDYNKYFERKDNALINLQLKDALISKHLVFIGYGLNDDNILAIINNIKKYLGNNMKSMFFVSPDIKEDKIEFLKENNILPISLKAEDVLNEIISQLNSSISNDFVDKKISNETYSYFCHKVGHVTPTTTLKEGKNIIESVKADPGFSSKESFNINISKKPSELIKNKKFNGLMKIPGTDIEIPNLKVNKQDILSFNHSINGINFNPLFNLDHLMVVPSFKMKPSKVRMDKIDFLETVNLYGYVLEDIIYLSFETPICIVYISLKNKGNDSINISLELKPTKCYKSYSSALLWCNFFEGIFKGYSFHIDNILCDTNKLNEEGLSLTDRAKKYYQLVRNIERETDIKFNCYENVSDENFRIALFIYHYKKSIPLKFRIPKNSIVFKSASIDKDVYCNIEDCKDEMFHFKMLSTDCVCKLNGVTLNIPYIKTIYFNCIYDICTNEDSTKYYEIKSNFNYYEMMFSDTEILDKDFDDSNEILIDKHSAE